MAALEARVDVLQALVMQLVSSPNKLAEPQTQQLTNNQFLPDAVVSALHQVCAGRSVRERTAAWGKAERSWANAQRGGGASEDYAKRLASEIHAGDGAQILDDDGVVML